MPLVEGFALVQESLGSDFGFVVGFIFHISHILYLCTMSVIQILGFEYFRYLIFQNLSILENTFVQICQYIF